MSYTETKIQLHAVLLKIGEWYEDKNYYNNGRDDDMIIMTLESAILVLGFFSCFLFLFFWVFLQ